MSESKTVVRYSKCRNEQRTIKLSQIVANEEDFCHRQGESVFQYRQQIEKVNTSRASWAIAYFWCSA